VAQNSLNGDISEHFKKFLALVESKHRLGRKGYPLGKDNQVLSLSCWFVIGHYLSYRWTKERNGTCI